MTPHLTSLAVMVPVMALLVWRRMRSQFGRQPIRRGRMLALIATFVLLGALVVWPGLSRLALLESLLTALLIGRLAWRFLVAMPQLEAAPSVQAGPTFGYSPLTMAMFELLVGCYVAYFSGLLVHHRRFERAQAALAGGV